MELWKQSYIYIYISISVIFASPIETKVVTEQGGSGRGPICYFFLDESVVDIQDTYSYGDVIYDNNTVQCNSATDHCFNIWKEPPSENEMSLNATESSLPLTTTITPFNLDGSRMRLLYSGCFRQAPQCAKSKCTGTLNGSSREPRFCCCDGDYCNSVDNILMVPDTHPPPLQGEARQQQWVMRDIAYVCLGVIFGLSGILFSVYFTFVLCKSKKENLPDSPEEKGLLQLPTIDLGHINFEELIGIGRYGNVYKAKLNGESVAVKVLPLHQKQFFNDEKYIYSLPLMEHTNLLSYYGAGDVVAPDIGPSFGLVLSLSPRGKLTSYLSQNTIDFSTFCQMVITATRGLAHLHALIFKGDMMKPCVAHRDFNTRNILLKEDLTCVVSDLGFAIHARGSKFFNLGDEKAAEMASLTDVGTLRYMSPEVLEGAVNLRDCETSLKQIDVYALGLVLWETAYRCHDLYQGTETPAYMLPFQNELGTKPTFEQMQVLVARNKARPLFPCLWKDSNPAIHQLKETIEDCWDNDAEARLSASCVEKRLTDLKNLWQRHKASLPVLPGISSSPNTGVLNQVRCHDDSYNSCVISNQLTMPEDVVMSRSSVDNSMSENTMESMIPSSPSDGPINLAKNECAVNSAKAPLPALQPHQGRNPCMERNTVNECRPEPTISGNTWVETSDHLPTHQMDIIDFQNSALIEVLEKQNDVTPQMLTSEHLVPLLNGYMPESQVNVHKQNGVRPSMEFFQPQTSLPPIPYLQNEVHRIDPKLVNANRQHLQNKPQNKWKNVKSNLSGRISSIF